MVRDIVRQGKYAVKVSIHPEGVFNPQQLRAQLGGPRIAVEEGSDTYTSFYLNIAEDFKDRADFFYWEGNPPPWFDGRLVLDKKLTTEGSESVYFCQPGLHRSPHRPTVDTIYLDHFVLADTLEEVLPAAH